MGLIKKQETRAGFTVAYWKITDWKISLAAKSMDITLTPYISNELRKEGYDAVRDEVRKIRATDYFVAEGHKSNRTDYTDWFSPEALEAAAAQGKTVYNVMYDYIKEKHPEFAGALDG